MVTPRQPASARRRTILRPRPRDEPVITATLPAKENSSTTFPSQFYSVLTITAGNYCPSLPCCPGDLHPGTGTQPGCPCLYEGTGSLNIPDPSRSLHTQGWGNICPQQAHILKGSPVGAE